MMDYWQAPYQWRNAVRNTGVGLPSEHAPVAEEQGVQQGVPEGTQDGGRARGSRARIAVGDERAPGTASSGAVAMDQLFYLGAHRDPTASGTQDASG